MLSAPAFLLFYSGRTLNNPDKLADESFSFPNLIASLSLANIGELSVNINQLDLYKQDPRVRGGLIKADSKNIEMFCETGTIGEIVSYGIALPQ